MRARRKKELVRAEFGLEKTHSYKSRNAEEGARAQWGVMGDYKQPVTLPLSALAGGSGSANMCVRHSAWSRRPRLFEKRSCWDPAVSAISSRDGMMMVASADVNAKRQAGGDENRTRATPRCLPRAPCPLRFLRIKKRENTPNKKQTKIEPPTFLPVLFASLSALNRAVSLSQASRS